MIKTLSYPVKEDLDQFSAGDKVMVNHPFIPGPLTVRDKNEIVPEFCDVVIRNRPDGNFLTLD